MNAITHYKVWVSIEPVDENGDKAGEDLDVPFAYSAMFKSDTAALDLANLMHEHGKTFAPYVEEKFPDEESDDEGLRDFLANARQDYHDGAH